MPSHTPVTDRILGQVQRTHGCDLDTLTNSLSDLSWSQVFLEVDRLSREGQVLVTFRTGGCYMIRLPEHKEGSATDDVRPCPTEVKKEDVKLTVQDDVMSISGERKYEKEEKGKKYHRAERAYGSFMRSVTLPEDADGSKVSAEYKEGVLKVHLPKSEKAKPKSIVVKVS